MNTPTGRIEVTLDIVPDDDDAHALLAATNAEGERLGGVRVGAGYKLNGTSAAAWVAGGYVKV